MHVVLNALSRTFTELFNTSGSQIRLMNLISVLINSYRWVGNLKHSIWWWEVVLYSYHSLCDQCGISVWAADTVLDMFTTHVVFQFIFIFSQRGAYFPTELLSVALASSTDQWRVFPCDAQNKRPDAERKITHNASLQLGELCPTVI